MKGQKNPKNPETTQHRKKDARIAEGGRKHCKKIPTLLKQLQVSSVSLKSTAWQQLRSWSVYSMKKN